eukprot:m.57095 g.57095  ORF g.57095 m.57095 type:complete len:84 (-) comp9335_c0_seq2:393-644(-)
MLLHLAGEQQRAASGVGTLMTLKLTHGIKMGLQIALLARPLASAAADLDAFVRAPLFRGSPVGIVVGAADNEAVDDGRQWSVE